MTSELFKSLVILISLFGTATCLGLIFIYREIRTLQEMQQQLFKLINPPKMSESEKPKHSTRSFFQTKI